MTEAQKNAALKYPALVISPFREMIACKDSFAAVCYLLEYSGSSELYIPALRSVFSNCITAALAEEYNGANLQHLARKYEFSLRHVRNLTKGVCPSGPGKAAGPH